ncbi:DNA repair protein RecN [Halalkalibacillus sediminis]|uniref:DNA repair protein RecN n=1 Tax=Halalkalibacillus sediminis TaxID=2018042 RepID=A0A2I0QX80_9BACI|nr:DNA repair protein RecN [Halalkalibacillus sediminis]PKR78947.1 DNA repair protein RecN [Halalkalibacillus sediminis]
MLAQISIKDFAIIDQITVNFQEGLTVLTGETGAGKSIIIDAIQLLAGARASVEFVRHDADQASIEGIFFIDNDSHPVKNVISQLDLPEDEEGSVILERFITSKGKSICRVNGKLVTLGILKEVGQKLIDIHSQHETQSLMNPEKHVELLDYFNGQKIDSAKKSYLEVYNEWSTIQKRFKDLSENEQEVAQRVDLLKFQLNELQEAQLEVDEDEQLEEERNQLANFEKIFEGLQATYYSLYGENKGLDFLSNAMTSLEMLEDVDESLQTLSEQMKSAYFTIEELSFELRNRLDSLEYQPERLNEIESRLNELNRLKRKYGQSIKELVDLMISMEEELEKLENKDTHLHALEKQIKELTEDALMEAQNLHEIRIQTSRELKDSIHKELKDLYLDKATFDVEFTRASGNISWKDESIRLMKNGIDQIQFLISTNPGEPVKPLHKVASGGEISRIMLALKSIFSQHQGITSVIFDEVDTGVSGRVAQSIAQKIQEISKGSQVLCISHLPQVAAMADQHLLIEKDQDLNQTKTSVKKLEKEQSVEEIGRMISGSELTDATKKHALELIEQANNQKAKG